MKELYEAALSRLTDQVAAIKMIDFEMGQMDALALNVRPAVIFPCAFLDIAYPRCEDEGNKTQLVTARLSIRMGFETPLPTDSKASETRRSAALAIFSTVDQVYAALQGYSTNEFSAFSRVSQSTDNKYAGIKIINMVFETTFEDLTAYQE
jgi:hypothetical protein